MHRHKTEDMDFRYQQVEGGCRYPAYHKQLLRDQDRLFLQLQSSILCLHIHPESLNAQLHLY